MKTNERTAYLTKQLITYIGNKRQLLNEIEEEVILVCKELNKEKIVSVDLFSGSGVVARLFKKYSCKIIANDLEAYSKVLNECFLSNRKDFDRKEFDKYLNRIEQKVKQNPINGVIRNNYSPKDDKNIYGSDRVFYTNENAMLIDSYRFYIDDIVPENYKKYFLASLLIEASVHVNTCGVFKGFYKDKETKIGHFGGNGENALKRIKGKIKIEAPVLSNYSCDCIVYQKDANELSKELKNIDLVYLDPPYNQHPYGSNYFMLNIILKNNIDAETSKVSGIPKNWNRSIYNNKKKALEGLEDIIKSLDSKYFLISYNNEGFITFSEMLDMLRKFGSIRTKKIKYNTFRGSRNLFNRNVYTDEYLFLLKKEN